MTGQESHVPMIPSMTSGPSAKKPQYFFALAATSVVFAGGTIIGWSSPALAEMLKPNSTLPVTPHEGSWIGSLLPVGAFIGALPAGTVADLIGRKTSLMTMVIPQLISWILIYFAKSVNTIYLGRLIGGVGLGAITCLVPMYVSEIAEDSIRGALGSLFKLMLVAGVLYTFILGAVVHYSLLPLFGAIINIMFLAAFFRAPETPVYLLKKGKMHQAEISLQRLRGSKNDIQKELNLIEKSLSEGCAVKMSFIQAMSKRASIMSMIICLGMMFFQQFNGISAVIFYAGSIFHDAGSSLDPDIATILVGTAQVVSTIISISLIDRAGRKILLQFSGFVMSLCLVVLGYYFHLKTNGFDISSLGMIPPVAAVIFIMAYALGFGPIPWIVAGEIFPPEIKGQSSGIASAVHWLLVFTISKSFHPLLHSVGSAVTYWIFAAICFLGVFFVTFLVFETKGLNINEIQEILRGKKVTKTKNVVI